MGRIEDERNAARDAERRVLERRNEQLRAKKNEQQAATFEQRLSPQQEQRAEKQRQKQLSTRNVISRLLAEEGGEPLEGNAPLPDGESSPQRAAREGAPPRPSKPGNLQSEQQRLEGQKTQEQRAGDQRTGAERADHRKAGARTDNETLDRRKGESDKASDVRARAGAPPSGGGGASVDEDAGGGGGGGGDKRESKGDLGGQFRLNPALLAPAPVASPRTTMVSERLRQLAAEVAQKIVERARVGTNAAGHAEFQIDLRSNVLAGLSIRISSAKGRVRASFSTSDKAVLEQLRQNAPALKSALTARGLTLEELRIEEPR